MRAVILCVGLIFSSLQLIGQFNVKAGYRFGVLKNHAVFDSIVSLHNKSQEYTSKPGFKSLKVLNGADLGVTYAFSNFGIEAGWIFMRQQLRAQGRYSNGNEYVNRITTSLNEASLGFLAYIGQVNIKATVDYNEMKIKGDFEQPPNSFKVKDWAVSSHFGFGYTFKTNSLLAISIEPYAQIFWNDFNLKGFATELGVNEDYKGPYNQNFNMFGIAFIIYNGPPHRK